MFTKYRLVRLEEGVLVELISDNPLEDLQRFASFLRKFNEKEEAKVPIFKDGNGQIVLGIGDNEAVPLPREVVKTLYKAPTLIVAIGNEEVAEEVVRYSLVPEVVLKELL